MTIIDSHLHVWDPSRVRHEWLGPQHGPINRMMDLAEAREVLHDSGVDEAVLVQSIDTEEESDYLVEVAAVEGMIAGVVAWTALDAPDASCAIERLSRRPKVVGVRSLVPRSNPGWLTDPATQQGFRALGNRGLAFDALIGGAEGLRAVLQLARRHPELSIVLDHLGKPPWGPDEDAMTVWRTTLRAFAGAANVSAKLSGLYPAGPMRSKWTTADVRRLVDEAMSVFGPQRLMLGGDWPICELAGGHSSVWSNLVSIVGCLSVDERQDVLSGTASRAYRLVACPSGSVAS